MFVHKVRFLRALNSNILEQTLDFIDRLRQAKPVKRGLVLFFETFHQKPVGIQTYPGKLSQHPEPSVA
jgi:hypothetical protein